MKKIKLLILAFIISNTFQAQEITNKILSFDELAIRKKLASQNLELWQIEEKVHYERQLFLESINYSKNKILSKSSTNITSSALQQPKNAEQLLSGSNIGFENGDFNGWSGLSGKNYSSFNSFTNFYYNCYTYFNAGIWPFQSTPGTTNGIHTIFTPGIDSCALLTTVPLGGGNYSVKLGNTGVGGECEELHYSFKVDSATPFFIYRYAIVGQNASHTPNNSPYFEAKILHINDTTCNEPIPCSYLHIYQGQAGVNWQKVESTFPRCNIFLFTGQPCPAWYTNWQYKVVDLRAYIGQDLKAIFTNCDCAESGHWGYTYLDPFVSKDSIPIIPINFCEGDTLKLNAPFMHSWSNKYDQSGITHSWDSTSNITAFLQTDSAGTYKANTLFTQSGGIYNGQHCQQSIIYEAKPISSTLAPSYNFPYDTLCYGTGMTPLTGGQPAGGTYILNNETVYQLDVNKFKIGWNKIDYAVVDQGVCIKTVTDSFYVEVCTSLPQNIAPTTKPLIIFNPHNNQLLITSPISHNSHLLIYDITGQEVLNQEINSQQISISKDFSSGIYFYRLLSNNKYTIGKIAKIQRSNE